MANNKIQIKRTSVSGRTPNTTNSSNGQYIETGELALNLADGKLYTSNGSSLIDLTGSGGGSSVNTDAQYTFTNTISFTSTINATSIDLASQLVVNAAGDVVFTNGSGIQANGTWGSSGQVLTSAGTGDIYWSTATGGGGSSVTIANTTPSSPSTGDLWFQDEEGALKIYYADTDTSQWVDVLNPLPAVNSMSLTGTLSGATISATGSLSGNSLSVNNASITTNLTVGGNTTVSGNLDVIGTVTYGSMTFGTLSAGVGSFSGAFTLSNTISVTGNATFSNTITVAGNATFSNTTTTNAATFSNTIVVTGAATFSNTVAVTGAVTFSNVVTATNAVLTNPTFTNYTETTYTNTNIGSAFTANLALGTIQILTMSSNATITMPTAAAGKSFQLFLYPNTYSVTWSTVRWPSSVVPILSTISGKVDVFSFFSDGTYWYGGTVGQNY